MYFLLLYYVSKYILFSTNNKYLYNYFTWYYNNNFFNNRLIIFPVNTPKSKEEFLFRRIFEKHFPGDDCALCVPSSKSVACSTEEALKWDKSFLDMNDPSGRSIKKVHKDSY